MTTSKTSPFESNGFLVQSYIDAFKLVPHIPKGIFAKHGIGRLSPSGEYTFDPSVPCPIDRVIAATNEIAEKVGSQKAFEMGLAIVKNATLPPGANDLVSALQVFDAGYHLNHYRNGQLMFDAKTGRMLEGIGHYKYVSREERRVLMEVDVPYHCDLDRGIMQAWAARFERSALVTHLEPEVCRKRGALKCRYEVTWK